MNMGGPPTPDPADRPSAPDEPAQDWAPVTDDDPPPRRSPATSLPDDVKVAPLDPAAAPARPSGGAHRTPRREPHAPPPGPPGPAPQAGAPSAADTAPPERDPRPLTTAPPSPRPADDGEYTRAVPVPAPGRGAHRPPAAPPAGAPSPGPAAAEETAAADAPAAHAERPAGLSAEPTPATPASAQEPRAEERPAERAAARPPEDFLRAFTGGDAWRAMLAVAEEAFAGTDVREALALRVGEALERQTPAPRGPRTPFPVWTGTEGLTLDLSAHVTGAPAGVLGAPRTAGAGAATPGRIGLRRRHGVLVIDALPPRPADRPSGEAGRPDGTVEAADADETADEPDTGAVILTDLRRTGARVLDAAALWRHACRVVTAALYDPRSPATGERTRRSLRTLRHVGCLDPGLGLGVVLHLDRDRRPRCPLGFVIEAEPATGRTAVRLLRA